MSKKLSIQSNIKHDECQTPKEGIIPLILFSEKIVGEIFKDIKCYEGRYKISNFGRVISLSEMNRRGSKLFSKTYKNYRGYIQVALFIGKKRKSHLIHRLIAEAFIPNPKNLKFINHKNGIKDDNRIENLEWVTSSENMQHAFDNNLCNLRKKVLQLDYNNNLINEFPGLRIAEKQTGISHCNISMCCNGKQKTSRGFIWKFKE
ncbi:MAG: HNH endonuclease [Nanoarchaeota archaeon]|nr:HNH endonuclease [Nanoarchaeota archaeon]